jgi:uncharacterized protein (TIGR02996 family)
MYEQSFLKAIEEHPEDETMRLVYADWLEEQGDIRGEFLRLEVLLAKLGTDDTRYEKLQARFRELTVGLDGHWLKAVNRATLQVGGMEFVLVPKGKSWLGGSDFPQYNRAVQFDYDFYLGKYPVTQKQWQTVMGNGPSSDFPVGSVRWADITDFLCRLNASQKVDGCG